MLELELKEIITKNLPEQVSNVLKVQLAKVDTLQKEVERLTKENQNLDKQNSSLAATVHQQGLKIIKQEEMDKREKEVLKAETKREVLQIQVTEADRRADLAKELVSLVFQNKELKRTVSTFGTTSSPNKDGGYPTCLPFDSTTTVVEN